MTEPKLAIPGRPVVLFGSGGNIGSALRRAVGSLRPVHLVRWSDLAAYSGPGGLRQLLARVVGPDQAGDFVFANGLTDSAAPGQAIAWSNLGFPQAVIEATAVVGSSRYLTLGTILEHFPEACERNAYLHSKLLLGTWVRETATDRSLSARVMHVRLHTAYGGQPRPHMFLGQMIRSIVEQEEFKMSSGVQLREYHHVDDIAQSLATLIDHEWSQGSIVDVNNGAPVRLADIARRVFADQGLLPLLKVGALPSPVVENTTRAFPRSSDWLLPQSRDTIPGIIEWVRQTTHRAPQDGGTSDNGLS